jgi:protein kinase C substrate 80K-H
LSQEADEARKSFDDADRSLHSIENELGDLKKKLELDAGPNGEFLSMIDTCFELEDREYIYKLCAFDKTVQKSKSNNAETSIGVWHSWGDGPNKYGLMKFMNGLSCWNGMLSFCC